MKFDQIIQLIEAVSDSNLTTFKYEEGDVKILLRTNETPIITTQAPQTVVQAQEVIAPAVNAAVNGSAAVTVATEVDATEKVEGNVVASPLVGTFYAAPSEDAKPFVSVGDTVKKGQVLGIVEAMKLMNEIESDFDGVVKEILVENAKGVEYGQPLFVIA